MAVAALLVACTNTAPDPPPEQPTAKEPTAIQEVIEALTSRTGLPIVGVDPHVRKPPAPPHSPPEPASSTGPADLADLIGMTDTEILDRFGTPLDTEERPPAMVWRYGAGTCTLDLFFYMDLGTWQFQVLAYESTPADTAETEARSCLSQIVERNRAG